jgi:NitT/TauT family transport system substrate-binding protein
VSTRTRPLAGLVVVSLLLAACSTATTPPPTATPAATPTPTVAPTKTTDGTLPKPELSSVRIAATIAEVGQFGTQLAVRLGMYERNGIQAQVVIFNDDGSVLQAMLSGQVDLAQVGVAGVLSSQTTDNPARVVAVQKTKVVDGLFCSKGIKVAADVKGKSIGVSSLGSTAHASALLALQALNLAEKDVTITSVGGQAARIAALRAGSIQCAPAAMDQAKDLNALGFNTVVDLSTSNLQYPASAVSMPVKFIEKNPKTALAIVAALLEAVHFELTDPTNTVTLWAAFAQIAPDKALAAVQALPGQLNPSLRWTKEGFLFTQQVMAIINPSITTVDVTKAYDDSFLKTLEEIGFYAKIGAPTS